MKINDNGPKPNAFDIETATKENTNYRTTAWTGKYLQVTLMSIPVGESIGLEAHPDTDQFLRLDSGKGRCVMGPAEDQLDFQQDVSDGWSAQVRPAPGTTSSTPVTSRCRSTPSTPRASSRRPLPRLRRTKSPEPTSHRSGASNPTRPLTICTPEEYHPSETRPSPTRATAWSLTERRHHRCHRPDTWISLIDRAILGFAGACLAMASIGAVTVVLTGRDRQLTLAFNSASWAVVALDLWRRDRGMGMLQEDSRSGNAITSVRPSRETARAPCRR